VMFVANLFHLRFLSLADMGYRGELPVGEVTVVADFELILH
jgi:hypothetical protein